ncbi:MAG TPA: polysaccharide biosynthesis tyrosine autokinase [Gemmatimonadaceae bacterium]|nr:polysaccharide biosynthesis tyrosine autokinase [Gemmatimonadaceae bacterium]
MSGDLIPASRPSETALDQPANVPAPATWQNWGGPDDQPAFNWGRYWAAAKRYKWLILGILIVGTGIGVFLAKLQKPEYEVTASVWVSAADRSKQNGPIVAEDPMDATAWVNLLLSRKVLGDIVRERRLYVNPLNEQDSLLFRNFNLGTQFRPGLYTVTVNSSGTQYVLSAQDTPVERGALGDSIGRTVGFRWQPAPALFHAGQVVEFSVIRPDIAAESIRSRLIPNMPERSSTLTLRLIGGNPRRTAATMNALLHEFVDVSTELKRQHSVEVVNTVADQSRQADSVLNAKQEALQHFRVHTITLPSESGPMPAGTNTNPNATVAADPVTSNYFDLKVQQGNVERDITALQTILAQAAKDSLSPDAFSAIPSVRTQGQELQEVLKTLYTTEAKLRADQQIYTENYQGVKDLEQQISALKTRTIPALTQQLVARLKTQDASLTAQIGDASRELQKIPQRSIDEMRLQNDVNVAQDIANRLKSGLSEAKLVELSTTSEVTIVDTAVVPFLPTNSQQGIRILLMTVAMSLAGGIGLAFLLDRVDRRVRYPEQVTHDLGLGILGAVPHIRKQRSGVLDPEETSQVIEAFRTIRLNLAHENGGATPVIFTVTSPGPGDGKSLISANLALSFAEAGYRTLLVDGDIRRGELHAMFGLDRRPGLTDYLAGDVPLEAVVRDPTHENLWVIPCGTRRHRGPELLVSEELARLMADLQQNYDAIIVDSPPLGAGVDPFIMATATKNMLMVLRAGTSDRKMAEAKLSLVDRLPVRLLGAVLNDIRQAGAYRYYSYLYGYSIVDEDVPQIESRVGELTGKTS